MIDIVEILIHWYAGRSQHELAASLGVDRKTQRKYTAPARAAGIEPGGPPMAEGDWRTLVTGWFPDLCDSGLRQVSWPRIEPHRDYIAAQLKAGVTAATIHQRLADERGLDASVASLRRWVRANLPEDARRAQVTVLRDTAPPGCEAQIDYGKLGMWLDPRSGRRRTVWAFVMVLCCSRHMFVRPTLIMDQAEWTTAHVEAFAFFGGVPARLVPDNLKTGVDRPDLYDPKINRAYAELAAHYGTLVDPARALKPKDKAQVERPMPYVRDSFWRGREFASLEAMRADAVAWSSEVAGNRACRPLDGAAPAAVFAAVEAAGAGPVAGGAVRAGHLVEREDRPGHPRQGRRHPLLAAVALPRRTRRRPVHDHHGAVLPPRRADQDPSGQGTRQADRLRRLPAGEDRLPPAHPDLVPTPGHRGRPGM